MKAIETRPTFRFALALWWLLLLGTSPHVLQAHPFMFDQVNDRPPSGSLVFPTGLNVGQEFVPSLSALDAVELALSDQHPGNGVGMFLFVRIRAGNVTGLILGQSANVSIPDQPTTAEVVVHFDLESTIPLTPGAIHVIELVSTSGETLGIAGTGFRVDAYPAGRSILGGAIYTDPTKSPFDLWFREGPVCDPIFDQVNPGAVADKLVIPAAAPAGQEFVPSETFLTMVELMVNDQNPGNGTGTALFVRIRSGSIAGPILGTSQTVSLPDAPNDSPRLARFAFGAPVLLVPGARHVLEVVAASGDPSGVFGTGFRHNSYPAGRAISRGAVYAEAGNAPFDLWFREGGRCAEGPRLRVGRSRTNLVVSWSTTNLNLIPQSNSDLRSSTWSPVPAGLTTRIGSRSLLAIPLPDPLSKRFFRLSCPLCVDPYRSHVQRFRQLYGKSAAWEQWMIDNRSRYETVFAKASEAPANLNLAFRYDTTPIAYNPAWTGEAQHMTALKTLAEAAYPGYHFTFLFGGDTVSSYANVIAGIPSNSSHASGKEVFLYYETIFNHEFGHVMGVQHHYDTLAEAGLGKHFPPGETGCIMDRTSGQWCSACRTALRIPLNVNSDAAISAATTEISRRYPF